MEVLKTEKCVNEEKLLKEALSGNSASFGDLVRHYEKFVFNTAFSFMLSVDDACDVAQNAFIKAWQKLDTFKGEAAFSTWLYRITANCAKDALSERNKRYSELTLEEKEPEERHTPEDTIIKKEDVAELQKALSLLDEDSRKILVLREFEELSYQEIAETLETELGTVKSRISRAREKLLKIILNLREQNGAQKVKTNEKEKTQSVKEAI